MIRFVFLAVLAFLILPALPASAEEETTTSPASIDALVQAFPNGITPEQLDAILAVADDAEVRAALRERLLAEYAAHSASVAAAVPQPGFLAFYGDHLRAMAAEWPSLGSTLARTFASPQDKHPPIQPLNLLIRCLALLIVGALVAMGVAWLLRGRRASGSPSGADGPIRHAVAIVRWILVDACIIGAFFVGALLYYAILDPQHPLAPAILSELAFAALFFLLIERAVNLITSPKSPLGALTGLSPDPARHFYRTAIIGAALLIAVGLTARILAVLGTPTIALQALAVPASAIPFLFLVWTVWARRHRIARGLKENQGMTGNAGSGRIVLPLLATVYLVLLWCLVIDAIFHGEHDVGPRALASMMIAIIAPMVVLALRRQMLRFYEDEESAVPATVASDIDDDDEDPRPAIAATADPVRGTGTVMLALWVVTAFLIVYSTAELWGIDLQAHIGLGTAALRLVLNVGIVVLIGFVMWSLLVNAVDRSLIRAARGGDAGRAQRLRTLLPLMRRFMQIVIIVMVGMVLMSSIGIEIGPLLAGAGVVGIAIGLGAQQTIADILAGVFFLLEDAFRVGDYVEVGNLRGTVESISLRSLKLRHHRGAIHTLPFGQMKSLTNYTRDWALMRLEFRVAPDTDTALVKKLVKDISKELQSDPEMGPNFIQPLKSQGIRSVDDGAIVIGVKFITKPGEQFVVRREAYKKILDAFRENGIELVGRAVVVKVEGDHDVPPNVAAAAASEMIQNKK